MPLRDRVLSFYAGGRSLWDHYIHRSAAADLIRSSTQEAQRSRLPQMAAALAYRTVFGLIPVFVVSLVALKVFFANDKSALTDLVNKLLKVSGLSEIVVKEEAMGPPVPTEGVTSVVPADTSAASATVDQWIRDLVNKVSEINFAAVGWVSLAALIYAAVSMLVEIERSFNQVYRVPVGRSWVRRVTQYWTMMTLGTLGLAATFVVGEKFNVWLADTIKWGSGGTVFLAVVGYLTTVSITTSMFLLAYTVIPNTRVKIGPAIAGAFLAAFLWESGKWGLSQYVRHSTGYSMLYGSLALLPLFLVWVYATWAIVLWGLNFAYYLQYGRYAAKAQPTEPVAPVIIDPASILAVTAGVAKRFECGKPTEPRDLCAEVGIPEGIIRQMLERLAAAGVVIPVRSEESANGQFTLARPPDRISAVDVLKVGEDLAGGVRTDAVHEAMHEARVGRVKSRTLASFLNGKLETPEHEAPEPPPTSVALPET